MKMRASFTIVELVVVILILGMLAAVAAPRLLGTSKDATENGFRQSLAVVRGAIEMYAAHHNGALPAQDMQETTFKDDLKVHLRAFPQNPFSNPVNAQRVKISGDGTPLVGKVTGDGGWFYDYQSGEFIANSLEVSSEGIAYCKY